MQYAAAVTKAFVPRVVACASCFGLQAPMPGNGIEAAMCFGRYTACVAARSMGFLPASGCRRATFGTFSKFNI
jgi:hypothetical protein